MDRDERAGLYAALGDPARLAMVDALQVSDRTFLELAKAARLPGNLTAHHLGVLEAAGLIVRRVSEGDHRRRYISLEHRRLQELAGSVTSRPATIVFLCTHNSARSQFAAARWRQLTGLDADSAGTDPAPRVHPDAIRVAAEYGVDLSVAVPKGYEDVSRPPDLVITVCDRAHEAPKPFTAPEVHWSIPDPVRAGGLGAFRSAFSAIAGRIDAFAGPSTEGSTP
jgi:protein-tyrosine-phosphatase/DNA-binding transcriptional ArsR family regulator